MKNPIYNLVKDKGNIQIKQPRKEIVFTFSNSGRNGIKNWFNITSSQVIKCLEDLIKNNNKFSPIYEEKTYRAMFKKYLTDETAQTIAAVQTLPLFELLGKLIHFTNRDDEREYKTIRLNIDEIERTISYLENLEKNAKFEFENIISI